MKTKITALFLALLISLSSIPIYAAQSDSSEAIPRDISTVMVTGRGTLFSFTPNMTGYWIFETSNNFDSDPMLWIMNEYGHLLAYDDDSAGNLNAFIKIHLVEGAEYIVRAGFWRDGSGSYMLNISWADTFDLPGLTDIFTIHTHIIPSSGGRIDADSPGVFHFTPDTSGFWAFQLYSDDEPLFMYIEDSFGNVFAANDFNFDNLRHADFTVYLIAGADYIVHVGDSWGFWGESISYTLSVTPTDNFEPWLDLELMAQYNFFIDLEAERELIPGSGGEIHVQGETWFSFTPDITGPWTFETANNHGDPLLVLTDNYGSILFSDDDGGIGLNALLALYLAEGKEYVLWARFFDHNTDGSYTLTVSPFTYTPLATDTTFADLFADIFLPTQTIPGSGGHLPITAEESHFLFTPSYTGTWVLQTDGNESYLAINDPSESFTVYSWDSPWAGIDNVIFIHLAEGVEYRIDTWRFDWIFDSNLSITQANLIRPAGDVYRRKVVRETDFSFIAEESGYWVIYTSYNGAGDPYLWVLDSNGRILAEDDDGGEGLNALIKIYLEAGVEYIIRGGFFQEGSGEYLITMRRAGATTVSRPRLIPPELR